MQKRTLIRFLALAIFVFPLVASAHALPVASSPQSSQLLTQAPSTVTITFSEHVDQSASVISVLGPSGATVSIGDAKTDPKDSHIFSVPIKGDGNGTYIVNWSAVSADDGHFTKGAYPFSVGAPSMSATSSAAMSDDTEVVELPTAPEGLTSAVELMGHGFLWAVLLLFAFAIRPLLSSGKFEAEAPLVRRGYTWFLSLGLLLAFAGGAAQLAVKATQLAWLRTMDLIPAFWIYFWTEAGEATVLRMLAVVVIALIFFFGRKTIFAAKKFTLYEFGIFLTLCVFAYERARISHATSNPFYPDFSILVNFFHVIEKDVWAGIVGILFAISLSPKLRRFLVALLPRAFQMLAIDFALVSVTASYIVWLHLKSFDNLFTTEWGAAFLELLLVAVLLVGMRIYHVVARIYRPNLFARILPVTLATEFAFAMLVVYCSSIVIITSPPLLQPPTPVYSANDQGMTVSLQRDNNEDGMLLLTDSGGSGAQEPVLTVQNATPGAEELSIALSQRFIGGYVFPASLMTGPGPFTVEVTVPQTGGYDAHASFAVPSGAFTPPPGWQSERPLDFFTIVMILIALSALTFAFPLYVLSGSPAQTGLPARRNISELSAFGVFLLAAFLGAHAIALLHGSYVEDPFAAECVGDGNEWHIMLPSMAGQPTSQTPAEGCMWGMGNYMYMFPDQREYDYYKNLGLTTGALVTTPDQPIAGVPTTLTVSLKNADGSPATLFMDMDKMLHCVIVSKDETVYAHIHPDDVHPLTQQEIDTSTYTLTYTFPKSGDYLVMFDYAHGVTLDSKQFVVHVAGGNPQASSPTLYPQNGDFDGYQVAVNYSQPFVGQISTFLYSITKNGKPVELVPYLAAAMHVSVVKNDFSWHLHVHGEVHLPGQPYPPLYVRNGQVVHSMAAMQVPPTFDTSSSSMDTHMIFPNPGLYTIWAQFETESGDLVPSAITVRVEQ